MTEPLDLDAIRAEYLVQCGPHDYGLPMTCNCPTGEPRAAIMQLCIEVERLRAELDQAQAEIQEMTREAMYRYRTDDDD